MNSSQTAFRASERVLTQGEIDEQRVQQEALRSFHVREYFREEQRRMARVAVALCAAAAVGVGLAWLILR